MIVKIIVNSLYLIVVWSGEFKLCDDKNHSRLISMAIENGLLYCQEIEYLDFKNLNEYNNKSVWLNKQLTSSTFEKSGINYLADN